MVGRNAGIFLRRARSGRGCLTRASVGGRAVAARVGLAWRRYRQSECWVQRRSREPGLVRDRIQARAVSS